MYVCATLGSTGTWLRGKLSKEKMSLSRYISHMRGGALIEQIAREVCKFVKVTNVINRACFDGVWFMQLDEFMLFP
jgi:hypothetical protein